MSTFETRFGMLEIGGGFESDVIARMPPASVRLGLPPVRPKNMIVTVTPETVTEGSRSPDRFSTTRWSVVLACADSAGGEETARQALADLCKTYWRPIFAFICRRGYSVPDAQDLTQNFLVVFLQGNLLKRADPPLRKMILLRLNSFSIARFVSRLSLSAGL
jgi:hypothetical protein